MSWLRIEDGFPDHPKVAGLTADAFRAHVCALCYCSRYLTDGFVTASVIAGFAAPRFRRELLAAGLWETSGAGVVIHDYLDYNPSRDEAIAHRERIALARREAGRRGGLATAAAKQTAQQKAHQTWSNGDGNE